MARSAMVPQGKGKVRKAGLANNTVRLCSDSPFKSLFFLVGGGGDSIKGKKGTINSESGLTYDNEEGDESLVSYTYNHNVLLCKGRRENRGVGGKGGGWEKKKNKFDSRQENAHSATNDTGGGGKGRPRKKGRGSVRLSGRSGPVTQSPSPTRKKGTYFT